MTRWTYDPTARVWPRVYFATSPDLINWSDPIWCEPWGIDPSLFQDPKTGKTYLNLMAPVCGPEVALSKNSLRGLNYAEY